MARDWPIRMAVCALVSVCSTARAEVPRLAVATRGANVNSKRAVALRKLVRTAATARPEVSLIAADLETRLFGVPPPRSVSGAVARAERSVERGSEALRNFDLAAAENRLQAATKTLSPHIGLPETVVVDRNRLFLAVSLAHAQRDDVAIAHLLAEYASRYPETPPTDAGWPPDIMDRLKTIGRLPQGSLIVRSTPTGETFVNGRSVGPTPRTVAPIPAGRHRVIVEAPGHYRASGWVTTEEAKTSEVDLTLSHDLGRVLSADRDKAAAAPETLAGIHTLARAEGIDGVLLVSAVDKNRMVVAHVDTSGSQPRPTARYEVAATDDGAKTAISQIVLHLRNLETSKVTVPYWAWIGAGTGAAAIGAGVALRFVARSTQDDFNRRAGAMTQAEAYDLRDHAQNQSRGGAILVGAGLAAIVGVASWVALDQLGGDG